MAQAERRASGARRARQSHAARLLSAKESSTSMLAANVSRASASVCVPFLGEPLPLYSQKCTAALGHPPRAILREARLCACLRVFVRCELEGRVRTRSYVDDRSALAACISGGQKVDGYMELSSVCF